MAATRIGEVLLLREALDPWVLTHTLAEQPASGQRLVSLLISRALVDPDEGALALAEHHNYPGALQRHLERADPAVLDALPAEVGRRWVVLPLGRARAGGLVVVARDPTPILAASLAHVVGMPVELAVTPAAQLERLVRAAYGELDELAVDARPGPPAARARAIADLSLDADLPAPSRPRTVSRVMIDTSPGLEVARDAPSAAHELDAARRGIEEAWSRAAAEQLLIAFAARRWGAVLLAQVTGDTAIGRRGHGARAGAVEGLLLPLAPPSILQLAVATGHASAHVPASALQARLSALLGDAVAPAAAPVIAGGVVVAVVAVGDPRSPEARPAQLAALADALGAAYERLGAAPAP